MTLARYLIIATTWSTIALGAVAYALVADNTIVGVISALAVYPLLQSVYRLARKVPDAVSVSDTVKAN